MSERTRIVTRFISPPGFTGETRQPRKSNSVDHLIVVEPSVVAELVEYGVSYFRSHVGARSRDAEDRSAEDRNLIGERRCDAVHAEELVIGVDEIPIIARRFVFDDDGDVLDELRETIGQLVECLFDELPEIVR